MREFILSMIFFSHSILAGDDFFEKNLPARSITTHCDFDSKLENGLFSIKIHFQKKLNEFYIMKGVDYETCTDLAFRIKMLKSSNVSIILAGHRVNSIDPLESKIDWNFKYIKAKNGCASYLLNYCYPEGHPHKMW